MLGKINLLWLCERLDAIGGVETLLMAMARNLDRSKFNIFLGTFKDGYVSDYFEEIGVRVIRIRRRGKYDFLTLKELLGAVRDFDIDVIHTHSHFPGIAGRIVGRLAGKKIISTYHLAMHEDGYPKSTKLVGKVTLPLANYVTFVSKAVETSYYGDSAIFDADLTGRRSHFTIYNGIDVDAVQASTACVNTAEVRESLDLKEDTIFLVTAGRLAEQKGHCYLIEAMGTVTRRFPNARLLIFGEGDLKEKLEKQIKDLGLTKSVRLLPPTRDILKIIAASDIFLLPSLFEGLPIVLLEAMAIGRPIVANDVTGINEAIRNGWDGILAEPESVANLASCITAVASDKELSLSIGGEARASARKRFDIKKNIHFYDRLYSGAQ